MSKIEDETFILWVFVSFAEPSKESKIEDSNPSTTAVAWGGSNVEFFESGPSDL